MSIPELNTGYITAPPGPAHPPGKHSLYKKHECIFLEHGGHSVVVISLEKHMLHINWWTLLSGGIGLKENTC